MSLPRVLLGCLLLVMVNTVSAGSFSVIAPQTYTRGSGAPVVETLNFTTPSTTIPYIVKIHNGGLQDNLTVGEFVSSSIIRLNGVELFSPSEFNQNTATVQKTVSLQSSNTLTIELRGKPGGVITLEVLGEDNGAPTITAAVTPVANANGWHNTNATVTFSCSDALSGIASCSAPVTVNSEGANQTVIGTAVDKAGNSASTTVTVNLDKTSPVVSATSTPPANASGWYSADVTTSFTCTDSLSGIASCSDPITIGTEGANQSVTGVGTDVAGNTGTAQVSLNIDKTAPVISAFVDRAPNANGWYDHDITVTFTCTDSLSGIASCPAPVSVTSEGANQLIAGTANDVAGNSATTSVTVNLDLTAPVISIDSPANGSTADANPPPITLSYADILSGIDTASLSLAVNGLTVTTNCQATASTASCTLAELLPVGENQISATIQDLASHAATAQITVTISSGGGEESPGEQTTTTTYNALGLVAAIDGPRTDVADITTFEYDLQGNLIKTTNALGHETHITAHDAHGRPLTIVDPNGTTTSLSYDPRGRLLTRTTAGQATTFTYDKAGNITRTTLPNGAFLQNTYDTAQRLTAVEDNLGNRIEYTLDTMGNRIAENVKDPGNTLTRTLSRTYNTLNRLVQTVGGANQTTTFGYDANGNQNNITIDPSGLNQATTQAFDALNRLTSTTDAHNGLTTYSYDAQDNLVSVTDPRGLTTTYIYDALDRLISQTSPDTGTTTYAYDAAGNRTRQTDARGITTRFTYDALNRLTLMDLPGASEDVTYTYDTCTNGIGRLCQMADESGTAAYTYDARGNLTAQTSTLDGITKTISYAYNAADQLIQMTYPGGRTVDYTRNALGQIDTVTTTQDTAMQPIASSLSYQPFGPMNAMIYGNGLNNIRTYDLDYRITGLTTPAVLERSYTYDAANNITSLLNTADPTRSQTFSYDLLNRLTDATGIYGDRDYSYDANGNRLISVIDTHVENYSYATNSHHLLQTQNGGTRNYSYDANGNTTSNTDKEFIYGDNNRLKAAQISGVPVATNTYNGRGERVKKAGTTTTLYYYDQGGQLIAELDATGTTIREYIYVDGQPLAYVTNGAVNFIHVDHLGTPQVITDSSQQVVWEADYEPFGQTTITTEAITNNLRGIGQYFDEETGLHYNYFRYLDPSIGRFLTSDPIGLSGGLNTYSYVSNNPLVFTDPLGLAIWSVTSIFEASGAVGAGASFFNIELESACYDGQKYKIKVLAVGPAAGAELRCKFCFTAPVKVQLNEATFDDHSGSDRPDPGAFNGPFLAVSAQAQFQGFGGGVGDILLGRATNVGSQFFNLGFGTFGIGVTGAIGTSTVVNTEVEKCNDCD